MADLPSHKREYLVDQFHRNPNGCYAFIGGFAIGSTGLNLQASSNHGIAFDAAAIKGQDEQVLGRQRRVDGQ